MKKVLFATTALIATAGIASAEVKLSGMGTMGVLDVEGADAIIYHNVDLYVNMSGETDNGLSFSAFIEYDENEDAANLAKAGSGVSDGSWVSVSGAFGTLTLGNTDGALDKRITEVHRIIGLDYELWGGYVDNSDNQNILRYDYQFGDFGFSASYADFDDATGVGINWSGDLGGMGASFGLAYEDSDLGDLTAVSAGLSMDAFEVRTAYWEGDNNGDTEQWDVSAQYSANGLTVGANYLMNDVADTDDYTVFVTYDLGGGATLLAQTGERNDVTTTAAGISLKF
ncbi:porin [Actibacterium sp. XHP0104]|uniref:porin n=1 Tax=Actibacterium sp. XHP0104 TaxID=2984335 RepID=UPI0021E84D16|nr:porin [Actibacterium sp. XHP0104]MCV2881965.1 porin [Actibacterium sp. XHP0104]